MQVHLAFQLLNGGAGGVDIHQRVMALAIFLNLVGHGPKTPGLFLRHGAALVGDDFFKGFDQAVSMGRSQVLACDKHGFVKRHDILLPLDYLNPQIWRV